MDGGGLGGSLGSGPPGWAVSKRPRGGERVREVHLEVLRTARVALLETEASGGRPPGEVWYLLHGYRQLARRLLRRFGSLAADDRLVVAPEGLSRFYLDAPDRPHGAKDPIGASWMTREDREMEIRDYVRYLDRTAATLEGTAGVHRTVLGFSQGAHTAVRWALLGGAPPSRLVLWGAGFPADLPAEAPDRLREMEVVLVRGERDRLRRPEEEEREEAWLEASGVPWRVLDHPGEHEITPEALERLRGLL